MERMRGTGVLPQELARGLGVVGVGARASGIGLDTRRDHPYAAYASFPHSSALDGMAPTPGRSRGEISVPGRAVGDVEARLRVRIDEAAVSFALIQALLADLPDGPLTVPWNDPAADASAFAATESPRGENLHWLRVNAGGTIERYRVRSASFANWPAVATAAPGNMVPDFPLINKSFELCYACLDR